MISTLLDSYFVITLSYIIIIGYSYILVAHGNGLLSHGGEHEFIGFFIGSL
jgi:hypothetical protein